MVLVCYNVFGSEDKSFYEWCGDQKGKIKDFLAEFESLDRIVLFDMDNEDVKEQQVTQFVKCLCNVPNQDQDVKYNYDSFREAGDLAKRVMY